MRRTPHAVGGVEAVGPAGAPGGRRRTSVRPARARVPPSSPRSSGSTCSACSSTTRPPGKAGEVSRCPCPRCCGHAGSAVVLLVGVGDAAAATTSGAAGAALARASRDRAAWPPRSPALGRRRGLEAFVVGVILGRSGSTCARTAPSTAGAPGRAGRVPDDRSRRRARPRGGHRRRRVALAGCSPRCPSNVKNPAWLAEQAERGRRGGRPRVTVWDEKQLAADGLRRHPRRRAGLGDPAAADPARLHPPQGRRQGRRTSCSSARASPSTPAACPSSPARRWST